MKDYFQDSPTTHPQQKHPKGSFGWMILVVVLLAVLLISCGPGVTAEPAPACVREGSTYTCNGLDGHKITIKNVPDDVTADLLEVDDQRRAELIDAPKEGTECIFMIAGDLVFYKNGEFATEFDPALEITYYFLDQDLQAFNECQKKVFEAGAAASPDEVEFLPVYFNKEFWAPFETIVNVDKDSGEMTIQTTFWGDQPVAGGTKP